MLIHFPPAPPSPEKGLRVSFPPVNDEEDFKIDLSLLDTEGIVASKRWRQRGANRPSKAPKVTKAPRPSSVHVDPRDDDVDRIVVQTDGDTASSDGADLMNEPVIDPEGSDWQPGLFESVGPGQFAGKDYLPSQADVIIGGQAREIGVDLNEGYNEFSDCVNIGLCAFWQIGVTTFVVNAWRGGSRLGDYGRDYFHLERSYVAEELRVTCLCPHANGISPCFHQRYLEEHGKERFPEDLTWTPDNKLPVLFLQKRKDEGMLANFFSVPTMGVMGQNVKSRAFVTHSGKEDGTGMWKCMRDRNAKNCAHINACRDLLRQIITGKHSAEDEGADRGSLSFYEPQVRGAARGVRPVSHIEIPLPMWARIPSDHVLQNIPPPNSVPALIPLGQSGRCPCSDAVQEKDTTKPTRNIQCKVFGFTHAWWTEIEVQDCPACGRGTIGPDCGDLGIFNWNNRTLFMHALLDDYTSNYTTSETPFVAWVGVMSRRYSTFSSPVNFPSDKYFREIWFSYIVLMKLEGEFSCPACGKSPKVTIWDGIMLSFSKKNILPTIYPPTETSSGSPIRHRVAPVRKQQFIEDGALRKDLRGFLDGSLVEGSAGDGTSFADVMASLEGLEIIGRETEAGPEKMSRKERLRAERGVQIENFGKRLGKVAQELGDFFRAVYGDADVDNTRPLRVYTQLLQHLAAEESALQMVNAADMSHLLGFLASPTRNTISGLLGIPALFRVVQHEMKVLKSVRGVTMKLSEWIFIRAATVLNLLKGQHDEGASQVYSLADNSWQKTGCYYSLDQIRLRPQYPKIPKDGAPDKGETDNCRKYYSAYGERKQTGGLMVAWCTHSIAYGFHCIPSAEGRNEVFSAIFTRWEKAPEVVVYDFACQLAPYCLLREPEFFSKTRFLIDTFHSDNHTKCGRSSFLTTYAETDPSLLAVNTSAAECGNGGLAKIRKSVRYMGQARAVTYTKVYLAFWNRFRIQQLYKKEVNLH